MTVARLQAEMSSRELSEWMAFERLEGPLGSSRSDVQAAVIAATVANAARPKNAAPARVSDFMPDWDGQTRPAQSEEGMLAKVRAANAALGGTESRRG